MEHLTNETLARLVDERPSPEEREHLASCTVCALELRDLRRQTEAMGSLPDLRPPQGDWLALEARLMSEGLVDSSIRPRGVLGVLRSGWMQAAAAVVLFLGGTGFGAALDDAGGPSPGTNLIASLGTPASAEEAVRAVRLAEQNYLRALNQFGQLERPQAEVPYEQMSMRAASLDALAAATQQTVQMQPYDPFFNGLLVNIMAERAATLNQISSTRDGGWF